MSTIHTRSAADVDTWLLSERTFFGGPMLVPIGLATIVDDGTTATVTYTITATLTHEQMLDLLEETR